MFALKWTDIDLETGLISINKQWTNKDGIREPKWGSSRTVPLGSELKSYLLEFKAETSGFKRTLLDSRTKEKITASDYVLPTLKEWEHGMQAEVLEDFCTGIGITAVKFHDLRATFITNLLNQGVPLVQVMKMVGHRKLSTTDIRETDQNLNTVFRNQKKGPSGDEPLSSPQKLSFLSQNLVHFTFIS